MARSPSSQTVRDMDDLNAFDRVDSVHRDGLVRLAATLNGAEPNGVPPMWHWTSFLDQSPSAALGPDGHPEGVGLIPHPPLSRRMLAGGRMKWMSSLPIGQPIRRVASVGDFVHKKGSQGPLAFATVQFLYSHHGETIAVEEQDIVYRPAVSASIENGLSESTTAAEPREKKWNLSHEMVFSETELFRFSALTFNSHRIHYDLGYAQNVERYPGLVVHGPLVVIQLLELLRVEFSSDALERLSFRAVAPVFAGETVIFTARSLGQDIELEAGCNGRTVMRAQATLRQSVNFA